MSHVIQFSHFFLFIRHDGAREEISSQMVICPVDLGCIKTMEPANGAAKRIRGQVRRIWTEYVIEKVHPVFNGIRDPDGAGCDTGGTTYIYAPSRSIELQREKVIWIEPVTYRQTERERERVILASHLISNSSLL